jgi:hypothetical protein
MHLTLAGLTQALAKDQLKSSQRIDEKMNAENPEITSTHPDLQSIPVRPSRYRGHPNPFAPSM